eukprot:SM000124S25910  [mRNA]  locus=s124:2650:5388:- [translate_table: standard]
MAATAPPAVAQLAASPSGRYIPLPRLAGCRAKGGSLEWRAAARAAGSRRVAVSCSLTTAVPPPPSEVEEAEYTPSGSSRMNLATAAVNLLFSFQPFFKFAAGKAREMIIRRGEEIGHPWPPVLAKLHKHNWEAELQIVEDKHLIYPEYYLKPFHAYKQGNLSWDAALEMDLAAKAVHAPLFDPLGKDLDPEGDVRLRNSYHKELISLLPFDPQSIVDVGCAIGLSTFALHKVFPGAAVVGLDLSPQFLAVANYLARENHQGDQIKFLHGAGEATGLPSNSVDLVSMCLVCHELPRFATKQIIAEAQRILRPGGALAIMEMNPQSPFLQRMVNNVFAFTAFKATEPYFDDYRTFPIREAIEERGFSSPKMSEVSPRHLILVAVKE